MADETQRSDAAPVSVPDSGCGSSPAPAPPRSSASLAAPAPSRNGIPGVVGPVGDERQVIDDAHLKRLMRDDRPTFLDYNWYRLVTLALIAVNVIVFAVEAVRSGTGLDISSRTLVEMGAMYAPAIQGPADLYRFVTPMFLHVDVLHLLFNMVALYSVGELLEDVLGRGNFLLLYVVAGITGNAVSYVADLLGATGGLTVSAGASTSIFGLFVAVALLGLLVKGDNSLYREYGRGMLGVIGVNVLYTFLVPNISVSGHLGGALGGLIAILLVPSRELRTPVVLRAVLAVGWVVALAAVLRWSGVF